MYCVEDLYKRHGEKLFFELVTRKSDFKRKIKVPEAHRPGLALAGYLKNHVKKRILVFGRVEIEYLRDLGLKQRLAHLEALLTEETPAVIIARRYRPPKEILRLCEQRKIALFRSSLTTMNLLSRLTLLLNEEFAPTTLLHGTLVEVFGVGVLIEGGSAVGKSEAALGLIKRGHRLVTDDVVRVQRKEEEEGYLMGSGIPHLKHHLEIRGIGILNVAHLYGIFCVRDTKSIDLIVKMEIWNDDQIYDRIGTEERYKEILSISVPYHLLPIKPGRDVVSLLETIALNHRLKMTGYHSAEAFKEKLRSAISGYV